MARNYYRKGIDPGFESTRPWIEKWMEDSSDISIVKVNIDLPVLRNEIMENDPSYRGAIRGKETPLHAYLKYGLFKWLEKETGGFPVYEQKIYSPVDEWVAIHGDGPVMVMKDGKLFIDDFDPSVPQLIEKGKVISQHCGLDISADLYCHGISVEIGYTQPFNLLNPLLDNVVSSALWVPFPRGVDAKRFDPLNQNLTAVTGYKFELVEEA